MRFKLLGTEFYISFLFAAVITAMIAFDRTGYILPLLFAVLMHEGGHLAAMWILDCAPKRVRLVPASVEITAKMTVSHKNEIAVALCGPLVNIILFITFGLNYLVYKRSLSLIWNGAFYAYKPQKSRKSGPCYANNKSFAGGGFYCNSGLPLL